LKPVKVNKSATKINIIAMYIETMKSKTSQVQIPVLISLAYKDSNFKTIGVKFMIDMVLVKRSGFNEAINTM
jgi:hypothetical protein